MKSKIYYSPDASTDLEDLLDYISFDLDNPEAAKHTVNRILATIDGLEDFPKIGTPLSSLTDLDSDYRFLVSGNYLVFYRINNQEIYVDRILHGKRNYLRILFPDLPQDDDTTSF